ncbi:hypothetical protein GCM10023084_72390 [Streptomyces lacrimifluminis]|uniref:Fumarylacetoacetase-like C-terminal domain-containing protein n=1 Tax=Streptomyces lacrimifluminis TaxID=1500077 RepID=A0A917P5Y7_9ACTN|nr:hypothetical protein GCM10012282_70470 [Streptomyces lacrimifluminis]
MSEPPAEAGEYIAGYTVANDYGLHDFRDTDAGSMLRVNWTAYATERCAACCSASSARASSTSTPTSCAA